MIRDLPQLQRPVKMFKSRDVSRPLHFKLIWKSALIQKNANICLGKTIIFLEMTKKRLNHGISQQI